MNSARRPASASAFTPGKLAALVKDPGDHDSLRGIDVCAADLARQYPGELAPGDEAASLFELLTTPDRELAPDRSGCWREALDYTWRTRDVG